MRKICADLDTRPYPLRSPFSYSVVLVWEESMGGYRYFVVCFYLEVVLRGQEQIVVVDAKGMASLLLFAFSKFCLR